MFELCILGFLFSTNSYKYELKQRLCELIIFRRPISDGTIYPVIRKLLKNNYIQMPNMQSQRHKELAITKAGKERFLHLLWSPSTEDISNFNKFYGYLHFAEHLSSDKQIELIEKRIEFIDDGLPYYIKDKQLEVTPLPKNYFHHHSELLAEEFYEAEIKRLQLMIDEIKRGGC